MPIPYFDILSLIILILIVIFPPLFYFRYPKVPKSAKILYITGMELILFFNFSMGVINSQAFAEKFSWLHSALLSIFYSLELNNSVIDFYIGGILTYIAIVLLIVGIVIWAEESNL